MVRADKKGKYRIDLLYFTRIALAWKESSLNHLHGNALKSPFFALVSLTIFSIFYHIRRRENSSSLKLMQQHVVGAGKEGVS